MKTTLNLTMHKPLLLLFACVLAFAGCRKGEDDPFVSLRTRKARICGAWQLRTGNETHTITDTVITPSDTAIIWHGPYGNFFIDTIITPANTTIIKNTWDYRFTGSHKVTLYNNSSWSQDMNYFINMEINKNGDVALAESYTFDKDYLYQWLGKWKFGGADKENDIEDKETVIFEYSQYSAAIGDSSYTKEINRVDTFLIERLANDELILTRELNRTYPLRNDRTSEYWKYEQRRK